MKRIWVYVKLALGIILIGIVLVFTAQNAESVRVQFLGWSLDSSLSLLIFLVLVIGVVSGFMVAEWVRWRRRKAGRK